MVQIKGRFKMIRKGEIIGVLLEYGLSPIESERSLDSVDDFRSVIEDLLDRAVTDQWKVTKWEV